jgi:hypothetical protein
MKTLVLALCLTSCGAAQELQQEAQALNAKPTAAPIATATPSADPAIANSGSQIQVTVTTTVTVTSNDSLAKRFVYCAPGPHGGLMAYVIVQRDTFDSPWLITHAYKALSDAEAKAQAIENQGFLASNLDLGEQFSDGCVAPMGE